jgi:thioesterase domain-containing protein
VKAAWTKIAPSSEVFEISGTHLSIMKMPHVRAVAERLSKVLAGLRGNARIFSAIEFSWGGLVVILNGP